MIANPVDGKSLEEEKLSNDKIFSGKIKYIDDFASSSDELDMMSEDENALPQVEQIMDANSF